MKKSRPRPSEDVTQAFPEPEGALPEREPLERRWAALEARESEVGTAATILQTFRPITFEPQALETLDLHQVSEDETLPLQQTVSPSPKKEELFQIEEEIGQGGMGIVYRARQLSLERDVALKVLKKTDDTAQALFRSEAHVTGRLEHANIIPVHFMSLDSRDHPQLGMKLIKGTAWSQSIHSKDSPESLRDHLKILIVVCNAVSYAHKHKILHRDIKPANVMIADFGQIYLVDWGLAVTVSESLARKTDILYKDRVQSPAGTPSYMAPELALGDGSRQDERVDVYLLGACLHELLTKTRRHSGRTVLETLRRAVDSEPYDYPSSVPKELAEIANKATAKDPEQRYQSADELRRALDGYLDHEQANKLIDKGLELTDQIQESILEEDAATLEGSIHNLSKEAQFSFDNALELWSGAPRALNGLERLHSICLEYAVRREDLKWAQRCLGALRKAQDKHHQLVETLEQTLESRVHEHQRLKSAAQTLDWSELSRPLGNLFIIAGFLGMLGSIATNLIWQYELPQAHSWITAIWLAFAVLLGVLAFPLLWSNRGQVLALRMFGIWGAVNLACLSHGLLVVARDQSPQDGVSDVCTMFAIGLVATAFQARRWLLAPAAIFFIGGWVTFFFGEYALEIFAVIWGITWCSIGLGLRLDQDFLNSEP